MPVRIIRFKCAECGNQFATKEDAIVCENNDIAYKSIFDTQQYLSEICSPEDIPLQVGEIIKDLEGLTKYLKEYQKEITPYIEKIIEDKVCH